MYYFVRPRTVTFQKDANEKREGRKLPESKTERASPFREGMIMPGKITKFFHEPEDY